MEQGEMQRFNETNITEAQVIGYNPTTEKMGIIKFFF